MVVDVTRKTVLLVDDDPCFVEALALVLETRYDVESASNGTAALEAIETRKPDLVVLDVMMDHLSEGFDVARALKNRDDTREIPIIMLTGVDQVYNMRMEVDESWVPVERYLEKPIDPGRLLGIIEELIG
jgi:CheY-like chemotaxis protein